MDWKFGQADNEIPVSLASMVLQSAHRGLDVLGAGGEGLAHDGDVPRVAAVERAQVGHASCDFGRRCWISHESDTDGVHMGSVPTSAAETRGYDARRWMAPSWPSCEVNRC